MDDERELHNQGQDKFVYTCNNCKSHVEIRYRCTVCDDFDLCVSCKDKDDHPHPMEKLGFNLDDGSSQADAKQTDPQARKLLIQRCIQSLVHACQCRDANCRPSCQKMMRVVMHTKNCKRKTNGGCPICKQLIALCCYHAKHCQETKCLVPFCSNIKHKIKQQQLQQRLQQAQLLRRRMAVMNTKPTGPVAAMQAGQQQQHQAQSMAIGAQMPRQPGVIGPVGQVGPQASNMQEHALQQLMQTLRSPHSPDQQNQILQILKSNPPLMAVFIKQRTALVHQQQPGQRGGGVGGPLGPNQPQQQQPGLQHMMSQQQQPQQQHPQQQQQQQQGRLQIQMLTQTLRSPYTPD